MVPPGLRIHSMKLLVLPSADGELVAEYLHKAVISDTSQAEQPATPNNNKSPSYLTYKHQHNRFPEQIKTPQKLTPLITYLTCMIKSRCVGVSSTPEADGRE